MMLGVVIGAGLQMASIAAADVPPHVAAAIRAVEAGDAARIEQGFPVIEEVGETGSATIDGRKAIALLAGCRQGDVRAMPPEAHVVDYACPARQQVATGCDSGDLLLILSADRGSPTFAVVHRRKYSPECPVRVPPPPPPPVDEAVARAFVDALVAGDQATIEKMVTDESFVLTVQRFPGSREVKEIGNARGLAELRKQLAHLTGILGKPKAATCRKEQYFEFCNFEMKRPEHVLMAFVNTSGSGIHTIRFDYAVRGGQ
ncbi:MAG: hypothetical protein ACO1O3_19240 [Sphingobium sp.]